MYPFSENWTRTRDNALVKTSTGQLIQVKKIENHCISLTEFHHVTNLNKISLPVFLIELFGAILQRCSTVSQ